MGKGALRARLYLFFHSSSCCQRTDLFCVWDCNLSLPQRCCQLYKCFQKLTPEKCTLCKHHLSFQMTQHGAPSTNKNGPKKAQRHCGNKNSFSEGLLCPLYSHWDSDNAKLLVGHKNWINWDTEETNESKETNSKNKWDKRWKAEMQSLNCSCNSAGNSHI